MSDKVAGMKDLLLLILRLLRRGGLRAVVGLLLGLARLVCLAETELPNPLPRFDQSWRVDSFQADAGLTGHTVADLAFETNGTLWAATTAGLYRFDGYRWARFGTNDGLPSLNVSCVLVTREGKLWVGTDKGAGVFDGNRYHSQGSETNLAGPSVRRIAEDRDGTVWFCSHLWPDGVVRAGLASYKDGIWTVYRKAQGLPHDHVLNYFGSAEDEHYVVTSGGLAYKEGSRWVISSINENLPETPWCISGSLR